MSTTGPEYTPGKRVIDRDFMIVDPGDISRMPWGIACFADNCGGNATEVAGNIRLSVASDNAVLSLAEHLGVNAVELAERLDLVAMYREVEKAGQRLQSVAESSFTTPGNALVTGNWAAEVRSVLASITGEKAE